MYFLYSFLLTAGLLVSSPYFLYQAWRHGKYWPSLRERLGRGPHLGQVRPVIWLHCVSVGETQAARPLARSLREQFPEFDLVITTTTLTGQAVARDVFADETAQVFYFPFDWRFAVRRALDRVRPALVLIMETEIWPNFLRECGKRKIPVAIVNGRLSEKSFRQYRHVAGFIRRVVQDISLAAMQTAADRERIIGLGLPAERALTTGNIKFDLESAPADNAVTNELRERFGLHGDRPVIVAASTHSPEEEICVDALGGLTGANANARLILVPRHPERFDEVAAMLQKSGRTWVRRSARPDPADRTCDMILLDSIGELRALLSVAVIVFVGGSIARTGGHNVLEPAALQKCIITGAHTFNFTEIIRVFVAEDALVQMEPMAGSEAANELAHKLNELLNNDERRAALAERALAVVTANRGATGRTIAALAHLLPAPSQTPKAATSLDQ